MKKINATHGIDTKLEWEEVFREVAEEVFNSWNGKPRKFSRKEKEKNQEKMPSRKLIVTSFRNFFFHFIKRGGKKKKKKGRKKKKREKNNTNATRRNMHKVVRIYFWVILPLLAVILIPYVFCSLYFTIKFGREKNIHPWSRTRTVQKNVFPGETLLYTLPDNRQYAEITLRDSDGNPLINNETNGLEIYTYADAPRPTDKRKFTVNYVERLEKNSTVSVKRRCLSSYLITGSVIEGFIGVNESSKCEQRLEIVDSANYVKMVTNNNYTAIEVLKGDDNSSVIHNVSITETYFFCAIAECSGNESVSFYYNFTTMALTYDTSVHLEHCTASCKVNSLMGRRYLTVTNTNTNPSNGTVPKPTVHISYDDLHKVVIPLLIWLIPVYIVLASLVIFGVCWFCIFRDSPNDDNFDFYDILDRATEKSSFLRKNRNGKYSAIGNDDNGLTSSSDTDEEDIVSYYVYDSNNHEGGSRKTSESTKLLL